MDLTGANCMASVAIALFVALYVGIRVGLFRRRNRRQAEAVEQAMSQLRKTGIFLHLGLNTDPQDLNVLQTQLRAWGYDGELDGIPGPQMIDAIERMADAKGVDLEEEALRLFKTPRYVEVLPPELQTEIVVRTAQDRLHEAAQARALVRGQRVA